MNKIADMSNEVKQLNLKVDKLTKQVDQQNRLYKEYNNIINQQNIKIEDLEKQNLLLNEKINSYHEGHYKKVHQCMNVLEMQKFYQEVKSKK